MIVEKTIQDKSVAQIKSFTTDGFCDIYKYDVCDSNRKIISINCYCQVDSGKQPFSSLTNEEMIILNSSPFNPSEEI